MSVEIKRSFRIDNNWEFIEENGRLSARDEYGDHLFSLERGEIDLLINFLAEEFGL